MWFQCLELSEWRRCKSIRIKYLLRWCAFLLVKFLWLCLQCPHVLVVCCVASHDVVRGLMEAQEEEVTEEGINYVAMRNLFVREAREALHVKVEKKTRTKRVRESAERLELNKTVNYLNSPVVQIFESPVWILLMLTCLTRASAFTFSAQLDEWVEFRKKMNPDNLTHPPEFIIKPRGQTVWEGNTLNLHCTVAGWPKPKIAWWDTFSESQRLMLIQILTHE